MFGRLGTGELVLILGIALVVFGPGKLPELGKSLGKSISEFKKFSNGVKDEVTELKNDVSIDNIVLDKKESK